MNKYLLYLGTNDKDTHKQELPVKKFVSTLDMVFDDYTIQKAYSKYKGEKELILLVTLFTNRTFDEIQNACKFLRNQLNQECIYVEVTKDVNAIVL